MKQGLVSVLTPMYNTGRYIHRLLDSVLSQTYPNIEMIVIDDGSCDNSKDVVMKYISKFENKGYSLRYEYQENAGQSVAIKNGLSLCYGEYLVWPDSDDYYSSDDAITQMVNVLAYSSNDFQLVRTQEKVIDETTGKVIRLNGENAKEEEDLSLFYDCLMARNGFFFCPGAYMFKIEIFRELTDMDIYTEKDAGQNWQLLLPILYQYRCRTILKPLYTVVARSNSHSRGQYNGYDSSVKKFNSYYNTQIETLKRIKSFPKDKVESYKTLFKVDYGWKLYNIALMEGTRENIRHSLNLIRENSNGFTRATALALCACEAGGGIFCLN